MDRENKEQSFFYYKSYPWFIIFLRLISLFSFFILGLYILLDFKEVFAYLWVLYGIFCLTLVLPLSRCVHCFYYGKFCNTLWGKVSACLFEKKDEKGYVKKSSFYILTYPLWMLPEVLVFFELLIKKNLKYLILFCAFILLWFLSKLFLRWACCKRCHLKDFCPEVPFK